MNGKCWRLAPVALLGLLIIGSCKSSKDTAKGTEAEAAVTDEVAVEPEAVYPYRAARTRQWDLINTDLDVRFNWADRTMPGKAMLTLTPYFYTIDTLVLDAKGFKINSVGMRKDGRIVGLPYVYADDRLTIRLDRFYKKGEKVDVWVDYTSQPELREAGGSEAITSDKGLYFINPVGNEKNKPKQIWTQGETEASSVWFPTIDSPNENMTQQISITVDKSYRTLSNGLLKSSKDNGDGTRTDVWKQERPHAPYLAMMAIGDFSVVKDKWRNLDVDYYVEKEYEPHARRIFGHTPEMIEHFSKVLGYTYPWEKYAQVVVRDYVSGAMENTTAVIHGEFMQQTPREMVDKDYEDVISHELFHHWFGDVVTCESWSNLPLNESFATYGEYIWREYKYGRESADEHGQEQLGSYLAESKTKQVDLVRFHYDKQEDMFDSHSYAKGGRVLHMLRKTIGDSAFYQGLSLYLRTHQFKSVEMHQLRLAMEEVSGQDLNWFFDQWFFSKGHPILRFETGHDSNKGEAVVTVTQQQDLATTPLYTLKFAIDLYYLGQLHRKQVVLTDVQQTFRFKVPTRPDLINVDAEKMLLCVKNEKKTDAEWMFQFRNAPLFLDRSEALTALTQSRDSLAAATVLAALDDHNPSIRTQAIEGIRGAFNFTPNNVTNKLSSLAMNDPKAKVRGAALDFLAKYAADRADLPRLCERALKDSSYEVNGIALTALSRVDEAKALSLATGLEAEARGALISAIGGLYARKGGAEKLDFFRTAYPRIADPGQKYLFIQLMGKFFLKQDDAVRIQSLPTLRELALNEHAWYLRLSTLQVLSEMMMNAQGNQTLSEAIMRIVQEVKANETDENILNFLGGK